jgi:hypothetical protein
MEEKYRGKLIENYRSKESNGKRYFNLASPTK